MARGAPKCRICGTEHPFGTPCVLSDDVVTNSPPKSVTNKPVVTNSAPPPVTNGAGMSNAERQRRYREAHREGYNAEARERMRRKRAQPKEPPHAR